MIYLFLGAMIAGIALCWTYGKHGGDEVWVKAHPHLKLFLHYFHHWEIAIAMIVMSRFISILYPLFGIGLLGFATGLALDDMLYHSFDNTFCKKFKLREDYHE